MITQIIWFKSDGTRHKCSQFMLGLCPETQFLPTVTLSQKKKKEEQLNIFVLFPFSLSLSQLARGHFDTLWVPKRLFYNTAF